MAYTFLFRALAVLNAVFFIGGCSTLIVEDSYRVTGGESSVIKYNPDLAEVIVRVDPDIRLYSVGPVGIPVIPTVIKISEPREINLSIQLTLNGHSDFSFLADPCLVVDNKSPLCPTDLTVSAVALREEKGSRHPEEKGRWSKVSEFYNKEGMTVDLSPSPHDERIDQRRVYSHYGYSGETRWDYLRVDVRYRFKCDGACPETLDLDSSGLVAMQAFSPPAHRFNFRKAREFQYHFLMNPGP